MSTATAAYIIPDLVGSGLWAGVGNLFGNFWPALVLGLALVLFRAFGGYMVELVREGSDAVRRGMGR